MAFYDSKQKVDVKVKCQCGEEWTETVELGINLTPAEVADIEIV